MTRGHYKSSGKDDSVQLAIFTATHRSAIGIDVHLDKLVVCYQRCDYGDCKLEEQHAEFKGDYEAAKRTAEFCWKLQPEVVLMESTSIYWLPLYEALEDVGFTPEQIVVLNARDVKAVHGRKTDYADAKRLAEVGRSGSFKRSFILDKVHRQYRIMYRNLLAVKLERQSVINRFHKLLCTVGVRASTVFSDISGKAASNIIGALIDGKTGPELMEVIQNNCRKLKYKPEQIYIAMQCDMQSLCWSSLKHWRSHIRHLDALYDELYEELKTEVFKTDLPLVQRLKTIPGVSELGAISLVCELGNDLSGFEDAKHLASWVGLCPGNTESAGKRYSGRCTKGNRYLRRVLIEAAMAASRTKKCFLYDKAQKFKERRGAKKSHVAIAHNLLRIIYAMYRDGTTFINEITDVYDKFKLENLKKAAQGLSKTKFKLDTEIRVKDSTNGEVAVTIAPKDKSRDRRHCSL